MSEATEVSSLSQRAQAVPSRDTASAWELSEISLTPGLNLEQNTLEKTALTAVLAFLSNQPIVGCIAWGRGVEKPDKLFMINEWQSVQAHEEFLSTAGWKTVDEKLKEFTATTPLVNHVEFPKSENPSQLIDASPVIEMLDCYFTTDSASAFAPIWDDFQQALKEFGRCKGSVGGWVMELVDHESLKEGEKGRKFTSLIGWESVEAHMDFRKTDSFKEKIQPMRDATVGVAMCHSELHLFR